ncbi:hypothetical protein HNY73_011302 [Argiope bruennichi]|uniref:Uncharacterized protein n=1 Tax=Argiope bruennichi TaxID=94029 RepID=A0A8T0F3P6_ARGBR|nr:hypothetical protein HNY73_011302 [Argiope bruennichi]
MIRWNRRRGNIKGQVTKLENVFLDKSIKELKMPGLKAELDIVLKQQDKFETLKNDYCKNASDTELSEAEAAIDSIEDDLQKLEISLNTSLNELVYNSKSLKMPNIDGSIKNSHIANNDQPKGVPIKLLKIPLPNFSVTFGEWNLLKMQFNSLINENPNSF